MSCGASGVPLSIMVRYGPGAGRKFDASGSGSWVAEDGANDRQVRNELGADQQRGRRRDLQRARSSGVDPRWERRGKPVRIHQQSPAFGWDINGNRTSHGWGGLTDGYNTHSDNNRLTGITGPRATTYTYDANGNTLSGEGATYTYSAFNPMATATKAGVTTTYGVNALGQRVHKKVGSGANQWFTYGPGGQMLSEYQSTWTHYIGCRMAGNPPIFSSRQKWS